VLAAVGARFVIARERGTETLPVDRFFTGFMTTALGEGDLLTGIELPSLEGGQAAAYVKFDHPATRYAVIGVAVVLGAKGGACMSAAVAMGGLVPTPLRATSVERALVGQALSDEVLGRAAAAVAADLGGDIVGDLYASAEYRKAVAPVWVRRALAAARGRLG
jgi:carbon-monoxide dehydrogenase medium subunit